MSKAKEKAAKKSAEEKKEKAEEKAEEKAFKKAAKERVAKERKSDASGCFPKLPPQMVLKAGGKELNTPELLLDQLNPVRLNDLSGEAKGNKMELGCKKDYILVGP